MFNGIWLIASEPLTIQGREVQAGEQFHLSRIHSGALLVTGRATIVHPQPPPKSRVAAPPAPVPPTSRRRRRVQKTDDVIETIDDTPATPEATPDLTEPIEPIREDGSNLDTGLDVDLSDPEGRPKRRYRRRDLEAEV